MKDNEVEYACTTNEEGDQFNEFLHVEFDDVVEFMIIGRDGESEYMKGSCLLNEKTGRDLFDRLGKWLDGKKKFFCREHPKEEVKGEGGMCWICIKEDDDFRKHRRKT